MYNILDQLKHEAWAQVCKSKDYSNLLKNGFSFYSYCADLGIRLNDQLSYCTFNLGSYRIADLTDNINVFLLFPKVKTLKPHSF